MQKVIVTGWERGLQKVSLTQLLQKSAGKTLREAKAMVDALLDKHPLEVLFNQNSSATAFAQEAKSLGAQVEVVDV